MEDEEVFFDYEKEPGKKVKDIIAKNEKAVADFKAGKNVTGFLVGQCMKASKGQGNPQIINKLLAEELAKL